MKHAVFTKKQVTGLGKSATLGLLLSLAFIPFKEIKHSTAASPEEKSELAVKSSELLNPWLHSASMVATMTLTKETWCINPAASGIALNRDVTFRLILTNTGDISVHDLQITDDLATQLPDVFVKVVSKSINASTAATSPGINVDYNGNTDINIFNGTSGLLAPAEQVEVLLVVEIALNGLTPYGPATNQAQATGLEEDGNLVNAASDAPPGTPGNTGGVTDPTQIFIPAINIVKNAFGLSSNCTTASGNAELTLEFIIRNTGNTSVDRLNLEDNLAAQMGPAFLNIVSLPIIMASDATLNPVINNSFTGVAPNINIFNGNTGFLAPGQSVTVHLKILTNPNAPGAISPLKNQASGNARGLFQNGKALSGCNGGILLAADLSDSGNNPLTQNTGAPGDTGGSDDPALLSIPNLQVAMHIAGVDCATSGLAGPFDAIYEVIVKNTGNVDLNNFSLIHNMSAVAMYGNAFGNIVQAPQIVPTGAHGTATTATANPGLNAGYNGAGNLLSGGGLMKPNEVFVLRFRAELMPQSAGSPPIPKSMVEGFADGTGIAGSIVTVSDLSDSGYLPENTNPGRPGDTGGHCDPTPLANCWSLLGGGLTCNSKVQISVNQNCIAAINPSMILEGEYNQCTGDELFPLGEYYTVASVKTLAGALVPDGDPGTPNIYEVPGSYIGQTLEIKIMDIVYKNSCWGHVTLEDKLKPVINCVSPIEISCAAAASTVPPPAATDNCDPNPVVSLTGFQIVDPNICDDGIYRILRTYIATDQYGNTSWQCFQELQFVRPVVDFPEDINWQCTQYNGHPNITGATALNPLVIDTNLSTPEINVSPGLPASVLANTGSGTVGNTSGVCMYNVTKSDQVLPACGNTFKIIRTWTVLDWCTNTIITTGIGGEDNVQHIKIIDETKPVMTRPPFTVNANVSSQGSQPCRSMDFLLPPATLTDNCNSVSVTIITPVGEAIYPGSDGASGGFIPAPGLTIGTHIVSYTATDACGNQTKLNVQVTVSDGTTPTAVCDELTEVSLSSDGTATVFASTFDDGSYDNCCLNPDFQVRRMTDPCNDGHDDTVFGPSVVFCCNDVGAGPIMVVFRVFDCFANFNDCMVMATVRDKESPFVVSCPPTKRMTCDTYVTNYETQLQTLAGNQAAQSELFDPVFGNASFFDNCSSAVTRNLTINIDQCKEGTITRTWTAIDPSNNLPASCSQTIFVDHVSDWVVKFPSDMTVECGNVLPGFGMPVITGQSCEMIAIEMPPMDVIFTSVPGACYKIERTWKVTNWCVAGAATDQEVIEEPENQLGLLFPDCDLDGDGNCDGRTFRDSWRSGAPANLKRPGAADATRALDPDTDPDTDPWDGYITYKQTIKVIDTVKPVFTAGCSITDVSVGSNCQATVTLPVPSVMDCSPNITVTATGGLGTGLGPFPGVTPGTYNVTYTAKDNCNNQQTCSTTVTLKDLIPPQIKCQGLSVNLAEGPPPFVTVLASQLIETYADNCPGPVNFSFSQDITDVDTTLGCLNIGPNPVNVYATDASGNFDFCTVIINVSDNGLYCDDMLVASAGGQIATSTNTKVQNVTVALSGQSTGNQVTANNGGYLFTGIPVGNDVTLTPLKDDFPLNGVSTYDLVLISKHILGLQALDSPYKLIAADVNKSGGVTTFDLVEIRKLVLFINNHFPNNTSWRFVDKKYVFPNPANPWSQQFPEVININNIPANVLNADFVAIKTGDVNNSANPNLTGGTDERSFKGELVLEANDQEVKSGEVFTVTLKASDFHVSGYQFSLNFDREALEFLNVIPGLAKESNFGFTMTDKGVLTTSWNNREIGAGDAIQLRQGDPVFALEFRANKKGRISELISLNSRYTPAEAYAADGGLLDVVLSFGKTPAPNTFELYQNTPNPFRQSTIISFNLPEATAATLTITNLSGSTVKVVKGEFAKGYNEVEIHRDEIGGRGIFHYRLETPSNTAIKKAVLID